MASQEDLIEALKRGSRSLSYSDKLRCYKTLKERSIEQARIDPAAFVEYAIPHEKTRRPLKNEQFHKDWQTFFSSNDYGVIVASVEHGKTQQIAIGRTIWELGKDPTIRMAVINSVDRATVKVGRAVRRLIDHSQAVKDVFPDLRRSRRREDPWTISDLVVDGSGGSAKDPSVQFRSVGAQDVLGSRLDLAIIDDILNVRNTRTKVGRDNLEEWLEDVIITRIYDDVETGKNGRIFFIGNPWDPDDQIARLSGRPGWSTMVTSAVQNPDAPTDQWIPTWPRAWTRERLLKRRSMMTPRAFARKYLCRVMDQTNRRFMRAWLDHVTALGKGLSMMTRQPRQDGRLMRCFTGADVGVGKGRSDAVTSLCTLAVDRYNRRVLVDLRAGHWTGPEILRQLEEVSQAFDSEVYVEGNAAQRWMAEFGQELGIMATAVNTGVEKWDEEYGVEAIAVLMKNGFFIFPSGPTGFEIDPEVAELIRECFDFDPSTHTGDRLMSLWIADKAVRDYIAPRHDDSSGHSDR